MPKCSECYYGEKECSKQLEIYYYCHFEGDYVEECVAEDENCGCDAFVDYRNDDTTA